MYAFNAPVGYSKNPLNVPVPNLNARTGEHTETNRNTASLEQLPVDILSQVLSFADQLDVLSLAYTSKSMSMVCLPRIYKTIIVDSTYTQFNKEHQSGCTYVNLLFYLKRLLKSYNATYQLQNLYIVSLPDLFNVYDVELSNLISQFFTKLEHLREFVWTLIGFRLEYLFHLATENLHKIEVNLHSSKHPRELPKPFLQRSFPNLKSLSLCPVPNLKFMVDLLSEFLGSDAIRLTSLKLSRYDSDIAAFAPAAEELALGFSLADMTHRADFETDTITTVFKTIQRPILSRLTCLSLCNILVCVDDGKFLAKNLDLTQIEVLRLSHVSEYETEETESEELRFLEVIGPYLTKVKKLHLDFRETKKDSIAPFLALVGSLHCLDLIVRMNEMKEANVNSETMNLQCVAALQKHKNLKKISLEFRVEKPNCETVGVAPLPFINSLGTFLKLRSLRISSGSETHKKQLVETIKKLNGLKYLDDYGQNAGGAPNLGLGMVHPSVFDEWFKVQHVALLYYAAQPSVKYIRIKGYIFDFDTLPANPRSGIDRWFDNKVRVSEITGM